MIQSFYITLFKSIILFHVSIKNVESKYSTVTCRNDEFRFSNLYQDRMVLQRAPESATIWGYGSIPDDTEAIVNCSSEIYGNTKFLAFPYQDDKDMWKLELKPQEGGTKCSIEINVGCGGLISIREVIFGDVYLCSGQSNMLRMMTEIFNATEEIEYSKEYIDIRFTRVPMDSLAEPDDFLDIDLAHEWTDASDSFNLRNMSAICFLYARNIYDKLQTPMGLIASSYGGTPIESWSSMEMLEKCGLVKEPLTKGIEGPHCHGCLYNKMIYPLRKNTLKGFLWYQGENNARGGQKGRDAYNCSFPVKIEGWRKEFAENSNTAINAPYGFVQLSTGKKDDTDLGTPLLRWHQTSDFGFVPNERQQNVFMAVAIDTFDPHTGLHPRYKQIVGERLATTGMNIAYGDKSFPTNGPMIQKVEIVSGPVLTLKYDQKITYNNDEISGFYYCCVDYDDCDRNNNTNWKEIDRELVEFDNKRMDTINIKVGELIVCEIEVPHIAYLWRMSPVENYLGAPVYSSRIFWPSFVGLPSAPWKMSAPKYQEIIDI